MQESILERAVIRLLTAYQRWRAIQHLSRLSDHHLRDIGIERGEIGAVVRGRSLPLGARGVKRQDFPGHAVTELSGSR